MHSRRLRAADAGADAGGDSGEAKGAGTGGDDDHFGAASLGS